MSVAAISVIIRFATFSTILNTPWIAPKATQSGRMTGRNINHCMAIETLNFFIGGIFIF